MQLSSDHAGAAPVDTPPLAAQGIEARRAERFTILVRAAKLIIDGREFLCVLRDASSTGIKARLFHDVPSGRAMAVELGNGERHAMELMWQRDGHAGFRFLEEIDVHDLLDDNRGALTKRQIRIGTDHPVMLHVQGHAHAVTLRNLSQQGACIACDERLLVRQSLRICVPGFPPIAARVCWRRHPLHGLVFERGFTLEEMACNLHAFQLGRDRPGALRIAGK